LSFARFWNIPISCPTRRRIIWFNPEPRHLWGDVGSAIEAYRPFCREVRPCRNLNDLTEFISGLIL
jgi:hypothetical protein